MVAKDNDSVGGNDGKNTSAKMMMMPVQQWHWHGPNNSKDASNKSNGLGNNLLAQQKDVRADKRSGVEDMTHLQWGVQ
jgi:hypothetical protein